MPTVPILYSQSRCAVLRVEGGQHAAVGDDVQHAIVDRRAGVSRPDAVHAPDAARFRDVASQRSIDALDPAEGGRVDIVFALGNIDVLAVNDGRDEDPALRHLEAPEHLARAGVHAVHAAVAVAANKLPHAVNDRDHGVGVDRVVDRPAGRLCPQERTGPLVESIESVLRGRVAGLAPVEAREANDHAVFIDDRRRDSTAIAGDLAVLLDERTLPEPLAVGGIATQRSRDRMVIDVARLGVASQARPADARPRDVGVEDGEFVFPEDLACLRVAADDPLARVDQFLAVGHRILVAGGEINTVVENRRRGPAPDVADPQHVLLRFKRPVGRQVLFTADADHLRTAPIRPIARQRIRGKCRPKGEDAKEPHRESSSAEGSKGGSVSHRKTAIH